MISASSCERKWSAHGHVNSEVRNRLAPATTEKLVYIYSNRKAVVAAADDDKLKCTCGIMNMTARANGARTHRAGVMTRTRPGSHGVAGRESQVCDPARPSQTCRKLVSACASRGLAAALTVEASGRDGPEAAPDRDNGHGRAAENAGHLINAFASGRSKPTRIASGFMSGRLAARIGLPARLLGPTAS